MAEEPRACMKSREGGQTHGVEQPHKPDEVKGMHRKRRKSKRAAGRMDRQRRAASAGGRGLPRVAASEPTPALALSLSVSIVLCYSLLLAHPRCATSPFRWNHPR
eukprot:6172588-Pleurochrysis_carterae.AAC.1